MSYMYHIQHKLSAELRRDLNRTLRTYGAVLGAGCWVMHAMLTSALHICHNSELEVKYSAKGSICNGIISLSEINNTPLQLDIVIESKPQVCLQ